MEEYLSIAGKVSSVFLLMAVGAAARWGGWLTREADRTLATVTALILLPCFYFDRILSSDELQGIQHAWAPIAIGFSLTAFGFALSWLTARTLGPQLGITRARQPAFAVSSGVANYGYIPFPLAEVFFPGAVATLMVHNCGVDIALWSIGVMILAGSLRDNWKRAVFSPALIAVALALALKSLHWGRYVPEPATLAVQSLGRCAVPLGLMLGGAIIIDFLRATRLLKRLPIIFAALVIRLLVMPVTMLLVARLLPISVELKQVLVLQAAMPSATFPIVMVKMFDGDTDTAVRVALGTSLVSLVTIPLWILFGTELVGLKL